MSRTTVSKSAVYDLAKVVTTVLVVFAHAALMYTPDGVYTPIVSSGLVAGMSQFIYAFHMAFFIFLSGCVYGYCLEQGKYQNSLAFIRGKAKKLLIPYVAFGAAYVAPVILLLRLTNQSYFEYVLEAILFSLNPRHLWYIFTLFWIFVLTIPMNRILRAGTPRYAVMLAVSGILYVCERWMPHHFQLDSTMTYQLYFFLGVAFNGLYDRFDRTSAGLKLGVFACAFLVVLSIVFPGMIFLPRMIRRMTGCAMMVILMWAVLRFFPGIAENRVYRLIRKNSFGIYLFHPMIIYWLFSRLYALDVMPMVLVLAVSAAALVLSIGGTELLRKLRLQILIGER